MFCGKCGAEINGNQRFCIKCGCELNCVNGSNEHMNFQQDYIPVFENKKTGGSSKHIKILVPILLVVVLLVTLIGVGSFFLIGMGSKKAENAAIIGSWEEISDVAGFYYHMEFFEDGTLDAGTSEGFGKWNYVDDNRIKVVIPTNYGQESYIYEVNVDKEILRLTSEEGRTATYINEGKY